jgi:hypothetical protein
MVKRILDEYLKPYRAHVRQDDDGSFVVHDLEEHLRAVAGIVQCVIADLAPERRSACA